MHSKRVGFPAAEAEHLRIRMDLMIELTRIIDARKLTQAAAARLLHVTQPRISDLMRGKIDRFSHRLQWTTSPRGRQPFGFVNPTARSDESEPDEERTRDGELRAIGKRTNVV